MEKEAFIAVLTTALHRTLTSGKSMHSIPLQPISIKPTLTIFIYLILDLASILVPSGFPSNNQCCSPLSIPATSPAYLILLDFFILIILGEEYML
jgi:hypothetical protein